MLGAESPKEAQAQQLFEALSKKIDGMHADDVAGKTAALEAFNKEYGDTLSGARARAMLDRLKTHGTTPANPVAAPPPQEKPGEKQYNAAMEKLKSANPGFDGHGNPGYTGDKLTALNLERKPIKDLTPLMGLELTLLNLNFTQVADLTALKGMPLKNLQLVLTPVMDLAVLHGMLLTTLNLNSTHISNLHQLQGLP